MTTQELRAAKYAAEREHNDLIHERNSKIRGLVQDYELKVTETVNLEFAAQIETARLKRVAALEASEAAEIADAAAGSKSKYPVGTVLFEWTNTTGQGWYTKNIPWEKTGQSGVLEIITRESTHPGNTSEYSLASIGSVVLRLHKKNGELGSKYKTNWDTVWAGNRWLPEGVKPKEEKA